MRSRPSEAYSCCQREEVRRHPFYLVLILEHIAESPGGRLPLNLASMTRGPTLQHITERINLISAQHNLTSPSKEVASLLMLAFEVRDPVSSS